MQPLIVRGAPQEYICKKGAWDELEAHLENRNIQSVLVLHGEKSWAVAKNFFPKFVSIKASFANYGGENTEEKAKEFCLFIQKNKIEGIISVGGGKISDLGKLIGNQMSLPIIILPTLASTCAAYTPISVIYAQTGEMVRLDVFARANSLVLIDPTIIVNSPKELLVAGIGDTLAKWYEADSIISQLENKSVEIEVSWYAAKQCQQKLLKYSKDALKAIDDQQFSEAFQQIVETNILLAGMVGGFGDDYGRCSGAHSIHDALTILPQSHHQLHGNKVAYGIFVQLVIENKLAEINELLPFYHELGLPTCLEDLNMNLTKEEVKNVAIRASEAHETIHFMKETITPEIVENAMYQLEDFIHDKLQKA